MRTDLRHPLNNGMNDLLTWRNRYSKAEYPEKVVINIFYRKYTMEFMFPEILGCFGTNLFGKPRVSWTDFNEGYQKLSTIYDSMKTSKTLPILENLLSQKQKKVGNTYYEFFLPLITGAKNGDSSKLEEIEYSYLYYRLADECVLLWGAFGGTGLNQIDAIGKMSGLILETPEIKTYGHIEQILGQFCAAAYLKDNYKKLPPNV